MVARYGAGWTLAPCLDVLMDQIDARWPDRQRASDGSIGDARHQAESYSDHNPREDASGNWLVTAVDITAADWSPALVAQLTKDPRVKYVIWARSYFQRVPWSGDPVGVWVPYEGSDPHTGHIHVSVQLGLAAETHPWSLPPAPAVPHEGDDEMYPVFVYASGSPLYLYWPQSGRMTGIGDQTERAALAKVYEAAGHKVSELRLTAEELAQLKEFSARAE